MKQAVKNADNAYKQFFKGISKQPKFKSKHKSVPSFYVNYETLKRIDGFHFEGEKIGIVETCELLPKSDKKYSNPRITFDGKYWYLSIGTELEQKQVELADVTLGIDVGITDLAICSDGNVYRNINKTKEVRRLKKKLKREQRKLSKMREMNMADKKYDTNGTLTYFRYIKPLVQCSNYQKQKNKHLAKAVAEQKLYELKHQIEYKCKKYGIEFVQADRFYPLSKTCSCCSSIKKDLKLRDRTYVCLSYGLIMDRDLNASINLANYSI